MIGTLSVIECTILRTGKVTPVGTASVVEGGLCAVGIAVTALTHGSANLLLEG